VQKDDIGYFIETGGLPLCDGSNGVVGVDCLFIRDYPRKLEGTPYAPDGGIGQARFYPYQQDLQAAPMRGQPHTY